MTWFTTEPDTILRTVVGSTAHGLHVSDAREDRDEMGITIEPIEYALGVGENIYNPRSGTEIFDQFIYRTAAIREGKADAKSCAGDLDLVIYSLRKFCKLALGGNPTILLMLYAEPLSMTREGAELRNMADAFASKQAGEKFLGYMRAQRERLNGERGQKRSKREDLVEKYGFDTKYAGHVIRLGLQGVEFMTTGRLQLPMTEPDRSYVRSIRTGGISLDEVTDRARDLESRIKALLTTSTLPEFPDAKRVEQWMLGVYSMKWNG